MLITLCEDSDPGGREVKRHIIALRNKERAVEIHPLKQWLRENPSAVPDHMDPTEDTSHSLRSGLKRAGWKLFGTAERVILVRPDDAEDTEMIEELLGSEDETSEPDKEVEEAEEIKFGLERDLQSALRANIGQIEAGLTITDGGKEQTTEAGRIDITASDKDGHTVVIELKAGIASPSAVAQILSYMSVVSVPEKKPVRGILIAGDFHKQVIYAARSVPALQLKKYSFVFSFSDIP
jgi:hypothetical protein